MRFLITVLLASLASPAYAEYDCQTAGAMMAKSAKVMFETAREAGVIDSKTAAIYEESSNKYFACQKAQQWSLAVAPASKTAVVAEQTKGESPSR